MRCRDDLSTCTPLTLRRRRARVESDTPRYVEPEHGAGAHVQGIELGVVKREDVFVTTKLWNDHHHRVEDAEADSLKVDFYRLSSSNFLSGLHDVISRVEDAMADSLEARFSL